MEVGTKGSASRCLTAYAASEAIRPAQTFIFKLADRCNLACKYCYMFEFDTAVSRTNPPIMSEVVLDAALERIAEHLTDFGIGDAVVELHGGEPLLIGRKRFELYVKRIRSRLAAFRVDVCLQTNGVLLDPYWLDQFLANDVRFAVSLDGPPEIHDRYRTTARRNQGTGQKVVDAISLILRHPAASLFDGILCVVDPRNSGRLLYEYFLQLGLTRFDFLMPDANYASPAFHLGDTNRSVADFLIEAFDAWYEQDDPAVQIRTFRAIITALLGMASELDIFGNIDGSIAVVETDGGLLPHDVLRICGAPYDRATLNVVTHAIHELRNTAFYPWRSVAQDCLDCVVFDVCRGGYPPHRFDGTTFDNPSYYCSDLLRLIKHVAHRVVPAIDGGELATYPLLTKVDSAYDQGGARAATRRTNTAN